MHRTGTKHIVCRMQKSVVQWSVISKFTCTYHICLNKPTDSIIVNVSLLLRVEQSVYFTYFLELEHFTLSSISISSWRAIAQASKWTWRNKNKIVRSITALRIASTASSELLPNLLLARALIRTNTVFTYPTLQNARQALVDNCTPFLTQCCHLVGGRATNQKRQESAGLKFLLTLWIKFVHIKAI